MAACPHCNTETPADTQGCGAIFLFGSIALVTSLAFGNPCPAITFLVILWLWWTNTGSCSNPACPGPPKPPAPLTSQTSFQTPPFTSGGKRTTFSEGEVAERRAKARYDAAKRDYDDYRELADEMGFSEDYGYRHFSSEPAYHRGQFEDSEADFEPFLSEPAGPTPIPRPNRVWRRRGGKCPETPQECRDPTAPWTDDGDGLGYRDSDFWSEDTEEVDPNV
jgi:hypothetical protein